VPQQPDLAILRQQIVFLSSEASRYLLNCTQNMSFHSVTETATSCHGYRFDCRTVRRPLDLNPGQDTPVQYGTDYPEQEGYAFDCQRLVQKLWNEGLVRFGTYTIGLVIVIGALIFATSLLRVPAHWIVVGWIVLVGQGILIRGVATRQRTPDIKPRHGKNLLSFRPPRPKADNSGESRAAIPQKAGTERP
jgi:hypothetical protein